MGGAARSLWQAPDPPERTVDGSWDPPDSTAYRGLPRPTTAPHAFRAGRGLPAPAALPDPPPARPGPAPPCPAQPPRAHVATYLHGVGADDLPAQAQPQLHGQRRLPGAGSAQDHHERPRRRDPAQAQRRRHDPARPGGCHGNRRAGRGRDGAGDARGRTGRTAPGPCTAPGRGPGRTALCPGLTAAACPRPSTDPGRTLGPGPGLVAGPFWPSQGSVELCPRAPGGGGGGQDGVGRMPLPWQQGRRTEAVATATERSPLPWQLRRPPPKGRGRLVTVATREMESRGCRRGNREELGIGEGGGAVAMVTAAGGCPGGAAPLRHASFPATGAGCCGWGAAAKHICCGWMCEMTAVTADTLEMQSEQLRTGRLCGYVVHLAACFHGSYCASARVNFCIRNRECLGGYSWTWVLSRKTQRYVQNRNCSSPSDSQLRPWELHVVSQRSEVCNIPHPLA